MRAVISVIGKDMVGILALVSNACAQAKMNVTDVSQSVLQDMFAMIMMVEVSEGAMPFAQFSEKMSELGKAHGLDIRVMHEDIFNTMHRI